MSADINSATTVQRFVVGSYTESYGTFRAHGDGLSLLALNPDGSMILEDRLKLSNPSYVRPGATRDIIYVALETNDGRADTALVAIDRDAWRLRAVGTIAMPGAVLCHLDLHPSGDWIAGAYYGSGHVSVRHIGQHGAGPGGTVLRSGSSIHPVRQTHTHPHAARFSPDGRWLVVPDLGTDEVACYPFEADAGTLGPNPVTTPMPPGSGPRLVLFDGSGQFVLLVHELSSTVSCFAWEDGSLRSVAVHSALFAAHDGPSTSAGLRWHPSGRVFGVSNRGTDRIALFWFARDSVAIEPWCEIPSGGAKPRDFEFSPCGRWLITANQDGDSLTVAALDPERGTVDHTGISLPVRSPSCVRFI